MYSDELLLLVAGAVFSYILKSLTDKSRETIARGEHSDVVKEIKEINSSINNILVILAKYEVITSELERHEVRIVNLENRP